MIYMYIIALLSKKIKSFFATVKYAFDIDNGYGFMVKFQCETQRLAHGDDKHFDKNKIRNCAFLFKKRGFCKVRFTK